MIPKFRAFWKNYEEMIGSDTIIAVNFEDEFIESKDFSGVEFEEVVFMQSTGLFDKNGVEIFEGDVVYDEKTDEVGLVVFRDGYFRLVTNLYDTLLYKTIPDLKILGNIYENPELVEVTD